MVLLATEWQPFFSLPVANKTIMPEIMNQALLMGHAPAVRASRALRSVNVRKMCVRAISLARRKSLTLAAISATLSVAGVAVNSDPLTYTAAFVALGFVRLADSSQKGGEE
jgi:hypothetical protein